MTLLDKQLRNQALEDFACPNCGQPPGQRCRKARRDWLDRFTIYDYVNPHQERVELAYRSEFWDEYRGGDC